MNGVTKMTLASALLATLTTTAYANTALDTKADKTDIEGIHKTLEALLSPTQFELDVDGQKQNVEKGVLPKLKDVLDSISDSTSDLVYAIEDHNEMFKALDQKQSDLEGQIANKADGTEVQNLKSLMDSLVRTDNNAPGRVVALEAKTAENAAEIQRVKNSIPTNQNLDGINTTLKALLSEEPFELEVDGQKQTVEKGLLPALTESLFDTDENVDQLYEAVNQHEQKIDLLNDVQNEVVQNINGLSTAVNDKADQAYVDTNLTNIINHVNNATNVIGQEVGKVKDATNTNKADIANLDGRVGIAEQAVAAKADRTELADKADRTELANKADRTELADKADRTELANKADRTELADKADRTELVNKADRAELATKADKTAVETNTIAISQISNNTAQLERRITNNSARIDQLDKRVNKLDKKLERGLASQAALSGLFQPYNVGKVNVTAAVGGYKSKTAVAVGAGYRFNDKVAAKAGVSFSTGGGSAAYNVGINYEF